MHAVHGYKSLFLSEIATPDGTFILPKAINGKENMNNPAIWKYS